MYSENMILLEQAANSWNQACLGLDKHYETLADAWWGVYWEGSAATAASQSYHWIKLGVDQTRLSAWSAEWKLPQVKEQVRAVILQLSAAG